MWQTLTENAGIFDRSATVVLLRFGLGMRLEDGSNIDDWLPSYGVYITRRGSGERLLCVNARQCGGLQGYLLPEPIFLTRDKDADFVLRSTRDISWAGTEARDTLLVFRAFVQYLVMIPSGGGGGPRLRAGASSVRPRVQQDSVAYLRFDKRQGNL